MFVLVTTVVVIPMELVGKMAAKIVRLVTSFIIENMILLEMVHETLVKKTSAFAISVLQSQTPNVTSTKKLNVALVTILGTLSIVRKVIGVCPRFALVITEQVFKMELVWIRG
jgi:hypothetical protein